MNVYRIIKSIRDIVMENKTDKDTHKHKAFYEEFIRLTTITTFIIIIIVALMAIFLV